MGQGSSSCFLALSGAWWNMPNDPIVDDSEVTHLPEPLSQSVDVGQTSKAIDSGKLCDLYLKHSILCLSRARKMILESRKYGKVKLNPNQCEYLVERLEIAVKDIRKSFLHSSREHEAECLEALKFLNRLAKEVESFIQTCCCNDKTWLQVALTSASVAMRVSSIGYYLKLCTMLLRDWNKLGAAWLTFSNMKLKCPWEANLPTIRDQASLDEGALLRLLESNMIVLSQEVDIFLCNRLKSKQREQTPTFRENLVNFWEIDPKCLTQSDKLYARSFAAVIKAEWLGAVQVVEKVYTNDIDKKSRVPELSLAKLSHPNIVSLFGITMDKGNLHSIVMELMDGNLRTLMQQRMQEDTILTAPFSVFEACDLMLQVAQGVHYMHKNGVIHKDLKRSNILVRSSKEEDNRIVYAKVADMGSSKMNVRNITLSHPTWMVGTTHWRAPEIFAPYTYGDQEIPTKETTWFPYKSDVYSFSILCYEILTGDFPFEKTLNIDMKRSILAGERPPLPSNCPSDLKNLIELCWHLEPNTPGLQVPT